MTEKTVANFREVGPVNVERSPHVHLHTLPFQAVNLQAGFWKNIQTVNHRVSLKHAYENLEKAGNFHNLELAGGSTQGSHRGRNFSDEHIWKWLEAMAWELGKGPDEDLQRMAERAIQLTQAAQSPDGYLNSYVQVLQPQARWSDLDHGHELYCAGHLFQAGVAFARATGDQRLLEVSCRFADLICSVFGNGKRAGACGHPEVEMALVELYRETGNQAYLEMAEFFIDQRGQRKMVGYASYGPEYHQDHLPVRQARTAEGHAVRQMYLLSGVTDLYLETGEQALWDTLTSIWQDVAGSKLYITGGVGARYDGEAFGDAYELPADQCYCETCACVASLQWNWRMLLASGEAKYADLIERSLYNGILSSPALDGRHFFYVNPLMVRNGKYTRLSANSSSGENYSGRPEWHGVSCCPPNVMRTLASLQHYCVSSTDAGLQIHQYVPMQVALELGNQNQVALRVETEYPWQGNVQITITETGPAPWQLELRHPEWCQAATLKLNGQKLEGPALEQGYYALERNWQAGDRISLELDMEAAFIEANPRVDATRGCLAIQRGPLVYCLESHDQDAQVNLLDIEIDPLQPLDTEWLADRLGGVMGVVAAGYLREQAEWSGALYRPTQPPAQPEPRQIRLVAIPYYSWGNRGIESMRVWIPKR